MAGKYPQPSHEPPFQAPAPLMKQWNKKNKGWEGGEAKANVPQTAAQTLNEGLKDQCTKLPHTVSLHLWDLPLDVC